MNLADSPVCLKCNLNTEESVTHFIIQCPSLARQRDALFNSLRTAGIPRVTTDMLLGKYSEDGNINRTLCEAFGRFLIDSNRLEDI